MVAGISLRIYRDQREANQFQNTWDVGRSAGRRRRKQLQSKFLHVMRNFKQSIAVLLVVALQRGAGEPLIRFRPERHYRAAVLSSGTMNG